MYSSTHTSIRSSIARLVSSRSSSPNDTVANAWALLSSYGSSANSTVKPLIFASSVTASDNVPTATLAMFRCN